MKERPILFSAPMIRAILDGKKTQTRRLVGIDTLERSDTPGYDWTWRGQAPIRSIAQQRRHPNGCWQDVTDDGFRALCPYGAPGDRLWVREAFALAPACNDPDPDNSDDWHIIYRADGDERPWLSGSGEDVTEVPTPWRPSIFMPRWASRITLDVTDVRVERLQAISEDDARSEGIDEIKAKVPTARDAFRLLWEDINGADSWQANAWVWALTLKRVECGA